MRQLITLVFILTSIGLWAQSPSTMERVEAAKIALITERLELTPEQAEKFWPIYREFSEQQRTLRKEFNDLRTNHNPQTASEEENKKMLEMGMQIKERQLGLERTYSERMQQVITTRQLMSLRKAEDDFKEMLMKRIREQQGQRDQMRQDRMRNNDNMQRKRNN
ncbi:MAG: hypothetical protein RIC30_11155 [Marinoscillum sp.]|uniref:hypothetical protein n=1 Tax=Marinoscillum sp. TaxID=2024838 RepID=UPI0033049BC2